MRGHKGTAAEMPAARAAENRAPPAGHALGRAHASRPQEVLTQLSLRLPSTNQSTEAARAAGVGRG
ncbi:MAG TPA: hypothetical protein VF916_02880, partial [Ktedonobacterales bacterium]